MTVLLFKKLQVIKMRIVVKESLVCRIIRTLNSKLKRKSWDDVIEYPDATLGNVEKGRGQTLKIEEPLSLQFPIKILLFGLIWDTVSAPITANRDLMSLPKM